MLEASHQSDQSIRDASPEWSVVWIQNWCRRDLVEEQDEARVDEESKHPGPVVTFHRGLVDDECHDWF